MIDDTFHQNGSDGKRSSSSSSTSSNDFKAPHQSNSPLLRFIHCPFLSSLSSSYYYSRGYHAIINQIDSARHGTILIVVAAAAAATATATTNAFDRTASLVQRAARVTETERFERSKEYYYQPRVIAIYANIVALTRY